MAEKINRFSPSVWAEIQLHTILNIYRDKSIPSPFDDEYFKGLVKRIDDKRALRNKLLLVAILITIILAMVALGMEPTVESSGLKVQANKVKEALLFAGAITTMLLAIIQNDMMLIRAMLRANYRIKVDAFHPHTDISFMTMQILDMRYVDSSEGLPGHVGNFSPDLTWRERARYFIIRYLTISLVASIVLASFGIQIAVIHDVLTAPSMHWSISWFVAFVAILANLLSLAIKIPYWVKAPS